MTRRVRRTHNPAFKAKTLIDAGIGAFPSDCLVLVTHPAQIPGVRQTGARCAFCSDSREI